MKKISPYLLVLLGAVIIYLGVTGSLPIILDSLLVRAGLKSELEVSKMGFSPFAVPISSRAEDKVAPEVQITRPATGTLASIFVTPTKNNLAPHNSNSTVVPTPTPEPTYPPTIPLRLEIPSIELDAPIIEAVPSEVRIGKNNYEQWEAPDEFAIGWHSTSALLGQAGNTVLNGHHNINGKVFENLNKMKPGEEVIVFGGNLRYTYIVVNVMILPERNVDMATRMENARWILTSTDERLTLITCWPADSNTHRLIVVAKPLERPEEIIPTEAPVNIK